MRGLSVVDDNVAWVSGSRGNIGISADGGKTWAWQQIKGYEKSDFRDIEAFSDKEAIIMSSGTPAVILKTLDGGNTWQEKYNKTDSAYFLDAMDFADKKHGFIMGDAIKGKVLLLETKDGGDTWSELAGAPDALPNEGGFAASGTCLRVNGKSISIVTGGGVSRLLTSPINNIKWQASVVPLTNGAASRGAFSVAFSKNGSVIVGGNYSKDAVADSVAYLFPKQQAGNKGSFPEVSPAGYQSCVEYLTGDIFLATGTSGTNLSTDNGRKWVKIDGKSYNVCRRAKHGNLVLLAGDGGKIGIYKP
ncbi:hypothetical protein BC343_16460 [Mucilaginibacter pedocola]|uniref:Photosynthesis system II assembly factor Ycf48/Hcf136-like domain-containing protein n=1 Tax=Mucilaginibacter pedocola TaxID=1792845 RepID=A0A1S9P9G8_9SPHI|nr:hypothetical protein BC343_16460 [Mucilaginibacter pedocola]